MFPRNTFYQKFSSKFLNKVELILACSSSDFISSENLSFLFIIRLLCFLTSIIALSAISISCFNLRFSVTS
ncbi:MAG: hypothetical protein E7F03_14215 [Clostridium sp.]|nr:hypothetical protein [Clostridium sp.]